MKSKKVIQTLALTLTLATATTVCVPNIASAKSFNNSTVTISSTINTNQQTRMDLMKKCVIRNSDGTLAINENKAESLKISQNDILSLQKYFDYINSSIKTGKLVTDNNLNITVVRNSHLLGFSQDYVQYHWWGLTRYANNENTKQIVSDLRSYAHGATMVGGFGTIFGIPQVVGGSAIAVGYWSLLAERIEAHNNGNGVIVNYTYVGVFSVDSQ